MSRLQEQPGKSAGAYTEADMAEAWDAGFEWCYDDGGMVYNPYRKEEAAAKVQLDDDSESYLGADLTSQPTAVALPYSGHTPADCV